MSSEQVIAALREYADLQDMVSASGGTFPVRLNGAYSSESLRSMADRLSTPAAGEDDDAIDDVLHNLDSWCRAYPVDIFPEPEDADLKWLHATKPGLCDRISASMGRHMVKHMREMADDLKALREKANGSQGERGDA